MGFAIARFGLDNTRFTATFLILTLVAGLGQFLIFPRQEDPAIVIREAVITTQYPGMAPADVELLITRPIEAELRTMPQIKDLWSDSKPGESVLHVSLRDQYDHLDQVWQRMRNKLLDLQPSLPEGTLGPFVNDELGVVSMATIALWSDGFSLAEMQETALEIRDRLYTLEGIREVSLWGLHDEWVLLDFSAAKLAQTGINLGQIVDTLTRQNRILPGGRFAVAGQEVLVAPSGHFRAFEDIGQVLIQVPNTTQSVPLKDLLEIRRGYAEPAEDKAYFNGRRAIMIDVSAIPGINTVAFGQRLRARVGDLESRLPIGYRLEFATFQPELVEQAVNGALVNVYQTLVIVLVVVMLFLGLRTGLIVGAFVPLVLLFGLLFMRLFGIAFERISIASAIIALGMLVDNAIVNAEQIRSLLAAGTARAEACLTASRKLAIPLLTSSLTTILAFVPMLLLEGSAGEYAFSLPMVVIILLLSSWFLAMYQIPFLSYWFLRAPSPPAASAGAPPREGRLVAGYRRLLRGLLRARYGVILATLGMLVGGGWIAASRVVPEMFGYAERNQFLVYLDHPAGYSLEATDEQVRQFTAWLRDPAENPEITDVVAYVGNGGPRFILVLDPFDPDPHRSFLLVNTQRNDQVAEVVERVRDQAPARFPAVDVRVKRMWTNGEDPGLVEIRLKGEDAEILYAKGRELTDRLRALPGTRNVRNNWENKILQATVEIDQARARRVGISTAEVGDSLQTFLDGLAPTTYREGEQEIPLVLRARAEERDEGGDFVNVRIRSQGGETDIPLSQVAVVQPGWEFMRIARHNQERCVTIELTHDWLLAPQLLEAVRPEIEALQLTEDFHWEVGGEVEFAQDTVPRLLQWVPHCLLAMFLLLLWQFNSLRNTLLMFFTLPLAFCGAILGLLGFQAPFDFFGILGLLSLAGIIINNGIVLIDEIETRRRQETDAYRALVEATLSRFRPIWMTTITTLLGVLPLILSQDPVFYSMAILIASGLLFGTVLSLGVVPVFYATLFGIRPQPAAPPPPAGAPADSSTTASGIPS